jgi:hypothetical protein
MAMYAIKKAEGRRQMAEGKESITLLPYILISPFCPLPSALCLPRMTQL